MASGTIARSVGRAALALALVLWACPARADKVADAEALFNQAKELRDAGNYAQACPLFEDSQRLDPQLGTLINLADCYEKQGKWATAWARYKAAIEIAEKRGDDRIGFVREGKERVEPKVPKVVIRVTNDAEGLTVQRGAVKLSDTMYGVELPVDPGVVPVTIQRGDEVLEERQVEAKEGQVSTLELDLAAIAAAHPPPPDPAPQPVTPVPVPEQPTEPYDPTHRNVGIIISAVGATAVLVAGGLEIGALVKKGQANASDSCVNKFCTQEGIDTANSAKTLAEVGQWLGIGGLVTLAVGATVFFTAPSEPDEEAEPDDEVSAGLVEDLEVAPWFAPLPARGGAGGLTVGGAFLTDGRGAFALRPPVRKLAIAAGLGLCWLPACATILGVDEELTDAVFELCQCNTEDPVPQFNDGCEQVLEERLAGATEQTRERWLAFFVQECTEGCANAFACYQQDPTCSYTTCGEPRECCGFAGGNTCDGGTCVDAMGNPL